VQSGDGWMHVSSSLMGAVIGSCASSGGINSAANRDAAIVPHQ